MRMNTNRTIGGELALSDYLRMEAFTGLHGIQRISFIRRAIREALDRAGVPVLESDEAVKAWIARQKPAVDNWLDV